MKNRCDSYTPGGPEGVRAIVDSHPWVHKELILIRIGVKSALYLVVGKIDSEPKGATKEVGELLYKKRLSKLGHTSGKPRVTKKVLHLRIQKVS